MSVRMGGLFARTVEPDELARVMGSPDLQAGRLFTRFFDAERFRQACAATVETGELSPAAACALADCIVQHGSTAGWLEVRAGQADQFTSRFLELAAVALGDEVSARHLLDGGVLGRHGNGHHFLGSLPTRIIARQLTEERLARGRTKLQSGWDGDLLDILQGAATRAKEHPEELLVFVPTWVVCEAPEDEQDEEEAEPLERHEAPTVDLPAALAEAARVGASDLCFIAGLRPTLTGPFGSRPVGDQALDARAVQQVAWAFLTDSQRVQLENRRHLVTSFGVAGLGRFRLAVTHERGTVAASLRVLGAAPRPFSALGLPEAVVERLQGLRHGLVVLGGPPSSGRSTTLGAFQQHLTALGVAWGSLEQPLAFPIAPGPGAPRQVDLEVDQPLEVFRRTVRVQPLRAVLVDLVDDEAAVDLALDAAADGRLGVCVMRGLNTTAMIHRLAALDARAGRRRLSENLAAVLCQRLVPTARRDGWRLFSELLLPTESLRRHLRTQDTLPPPVLVEPEGPALQAALQQAAEAGEIYREA